MREIQTAALIGLGAIGGYVAPKLQMSLGDEGFTVIAEEREKRGWKQDAILTIRSGNFVLRLPRMPRSRQILSSSL